ncbi:MAG: DNA gyrase inhibitor YacG [Gemmatales bacterium]|nr:DNA gyrase inhibitor YacG [Gemmatales bacterium]MCS7161480.1 DNA gyrase inhibitor YacG [Gemmatales bacterium]MDW8176683.1 DNA gyrase inhibitor YacG [Gemmatales bacterium]MDW8221566.1 DNA gyrase inhibitor YacG [Gemmatales bacterium]
MLRVRCPICGKELRLAKLDDLPTFPFCSRRCRIIDTGRWLGGEYRIASLPEEQDSPETGETESKESPSTEEL